jgi:transposase
VVRIEVEGDVERLRQVALLLRAENDRLHRRLAQLLTEVARLRGEDGADLQLEIALLQEQLAARTRALFAPSSEKRPSAQHETPTAADDSSARRGHGPKEQPHLSIVEKVHTLDEADQSCPKCGGDLRPWEGQFEESDEIDVVERSFRVVRHKRQKYRCKCGECIETALGPTKLLPGGRYSVDFAVEVAIAKYADHLPLARQSRQMARQGLEVDTQTLWDQLYALARHLRPTHEALHDYVLAAPVIGADETTWRLMGEEGGGKTWWAWSVTRPEAVCYRIFPSRSAEAAGKILKSFHGVVVADGYSAYGALRREAGSTRDGPRFELAACWAHVRRKFLEAEADYPEAAEALERIGKLYEIEARARQAQGDDRIARVGELRSTESAPIVKDLRDWLLARKALPRSSLGRSIGYTLELWPGLTRFLVDPAIPIDNNHTERAMRGVAVGRKNHYGSRSQRGTEVAALFYSLIESAKLVAVEPAHYLREAARRAIDNPGAVILPAALLAP